MTAVAFEKLSARALEHAPKYVEASEPARVAPLCPVSATPEMLLLSSMLGVLARTASIPQAFGRAKQSSQVDVQHS